MTGDIVLYDGDCGPCEHIAAAFAAADQHGRFRFMASQDAAAKPLLDRHDLHDVVPHTLVLVQGDRVSKRSVASHRILRGLTGRYRVLGWLLWLVPWPIRELGYRIVARNRWLLYPFVPEQHQACGLRPRP